MIQLETFHESDENYLWDTYVQAMKPHIKLIWGWKNNWQKKDFIDNLAKFQTFILKFKNLKVGYIQLEISSDELYINMLILVPSWQSKGFGKSILKKLMLAHPNKQLCLRCFKINQFAYDFYLREGFEIIDSDDEFYMLQKACQ